MRKKRKARPTQSDRQFDHHHILFTRREWGKGELKKLRLHPYCVIELPITSIHRHIHANMAHIPPPKSCSAREALLQLKLLERYGAIRRDDPIEKRLALLAAIFDCSDQPTADALRMQLRIVCDLKSPSP